MKLYIDTNIYLSSISLTSDIESLEKIKKLIIDGKVDLILPSQTKKEYLKHCKNKIKDAKKSLKSKTNPFLLPKELKSKKRDRYTKDEKAIAEKIDILNLDFEKFIEKRKVDLGKHLLDVEKLIKDLFSLATLFEDNDDIVLKAIVRQARDLPPKKDNMKFGDAIIWETLKSYIRTDSISVVSSDLDFSEPEKKGKSAKINKILKDEWKKHTKKEIVLYPLLGHFVNTLEKENPISTETIKKEASQAAVFVYNQFSPEIISVKKPPYLINSLSLGNANSVSALNSNLSNGASFNNSEFRSLLNCANTEPVASLSHNGANTGLFFSDNAVVANLFEANTSNVFSVCNRCGNHYLVPSNIVSVSHLCNDCSKFFSLP